MAYTFLNAQDRALNFNYGTADRDRIKAFINMAQRDIASRHRWSWLEESTTLATVAATATTAIGASDFYEHMRLRPTTAAGTIEPEYVDWNVFNDNENVFRGALTQFPSGQPTKYSIYENVVYWYPLPDAVYTYTFYYWKRPTDLSADADVSLIPEIDRDVLVFGALRYAAIRDNDMTRAQIYENQYEGMIAKMWRQDNIRQAQSPRKVQMPKNYGGMYG